MKESFLSKLRRTEVFGMTMTELVLTLLFILLFAVLPKESGPTPVEKPEDLQKQILQLKAEINDLKVKMNEMEAETIRLKLLLLSILKKMKIPLSMDDPGIEELEEVTGRALPHIPTVKIPPEGGTTVGPGSGTGKANCLDKGTFLMSVIMYDDGYAFKRTWRAKDENVVKQVTPIKDWVEKRRISTDEFKRGSLNIMKWCNSKDCRFSVQVHDETTTKAAFINQLENIESVFYTKRVRTR